MRLAALAFWIAFAAAVVGLGLPSAQYLLRAEPVVNPIRASLFGTAWVAVFFWFAGAVLLWGRGGEDPPPTARAWWVAGCGFGLVHAVFVFALFNWSHAAAVAHTEQVSGFGGGVFVNYVFLAVWVLDAAWLVAA